MREDIPEAGQPQTNEDDSLEPQKSEGMRQRRHSVIDNRGRIGGVINPVDLLMILALVSLGIMILRNYWPETAAKQKITVSYGLLVPDIPRYLADSVCVGQELFQDRPDVYLGKIIKKQVEPATILIKNSGGIAITRSPVTVDLRLKLKRSANLITGPGQRGIFLGKQVIRVGNHLQAHTRYASITGEIESLRTAR